jgi:hypothetical protein
MSLSELRAELKSLRKSANPVPASRMKKADVAMEIARIKGVAPPSTPEKKEEKVVEKKEKKVAEKKVKIEEKKEPEVKKTKGVKSAPEVVVPTIKDAEKKPAKGSEEMKARMAALREKRSAKKE